MVDFTVSVPEALGAPDGVEVSADRRMVSMSWTPTRTASLRLDQFDAHARLLRPQDRARRPLRRGRGTDALWFEEPHEVALLEPDGTRVPSRPGSPVTP